MAAQPGSSGTICEKFVRVFSFTKLLYRWFKWIYNEGGDFTEPFTDELCGVMCNCGTLGSPTLIAPPTTQEFKALIVDPNDTLCEAFSKVFIQFPALFYKWFCGVWRADGTFTNSFRKQICNAVGGSSSSSSA